MPPPLKDASSGEGFVEQFANLAFGCLPGGFHGRTRLGAFRGIGNTAPIQRGCGGLVVDEVVAKIVGRALGDERKNGWRRTARLP